MLWKNRRSWRIVSVPDLTETQQAAGVYHRESRKGRYQLTFIEAKAVCDYEGGKLATYEQLEAARQIGFHVCAAGWFDKGRVGYPIVKAGINCGFGKVGIIDYGYRLNKSEQWDVYCYNPNSKECGGVLTDQQKIIQSPGFPDKYQDGQICYWHIRVQLGQKIRLSFLEFDVEDDTSCLADYLEVYDSYNDIAGFAGRFCGDYLPEDIVSTGKGLLLQRLQCQLKMLIQCSFPWCLTRPCGYSVRPVAGRLWVQT
uniref:Tumor necrosis factor-inducible gene 6 protein n=1 Tax=Oryzias sinensis TaxID=183150 RepID=A0A8C7Y5T0_9TELE